MENLTLEKYLKDKQEIIYLNKLLKKAKNKEKLSSILSKLAFILPSFTEYSHFKSYMQLLKSVVYSVENLNTCDEFENLISKLSLDISLFLNDLCSRVQVSFYFYGNDKYNLLNKKYLTTNIYVLKDFYEVNYIKKNKQIDKEFTVLLLEESVNFSLEFNIEEKFDEVLNYNKMINSIYETSRTLYKCDYNYNYLKNTLNDLDFENVKTLIVGNSYARTGINEDYIRSNSSNLSLYNQDLEQSFKLAKKAIDRNKGINKCIIGLGYYSIYYNLSKIKNDTHSSDILNMYNLVLDYSVNQDFERLTLEDYITNPIILEIFDLDILSDYFSSINYSLNKSYFNSMWTREKNSILKNKNFDFLHNDDKFSMGIWRATQHNKLIDSFSHTNKEILANFLDYLNKQNITPILVVLPTTEYYTRFLDEKYLSSFNQIISELNNDFNFKLIDFNNGYDFDDSDFIDVDHLNEKGSIKATNYLNNLIKWIK